MTEFVLKVNGKVKDTFDGKKGREAHRAYIEALRFDYVDERVSTYLRMPKLAGDNTLDPEGKPSEYKWFTNVYDTDHNDTVEKEIREERKSNE